MQIDSLISKREKLLLVMLMTLNYQNINYCLVASVQEGKYLKVK